MTFEFDENKSKINKEKHGIDFIEAQKLFFLSNHKMKKGAIMINMTAKEFDKKFEYTDINDLMDDYEEITLDDLKKDLKNNLSLNISLSQILLNKLQEKANELNLTINDTAKVLLAKELGAL